MSFPLNQPWKATRYRLVITMASDRDDQAQFFWKERGITPAFFRDRSVRFQIEATQELREYVIDFQPEHPIEAVRLDPLSRRGTVRIGTMKIEDEEGKVVYEWNLQPE